MGIPKTETMRLLYSWWITTTRSFSKGHPKTNRWSSSKWENTITGAIPSWASWDIIIFALSARPVSIQMTYNIIPARERNVALVAKPNVVIITTVVDKRPVTLGLDAIANYLESSAWVTLRCILPPTGKDQHCQKDQTCVCHHTQVSRLQRAPPSSQNWSVPRLWDQWMPILQAISWSHQTSMLRPESHQIRRKEKIIEILKAEGRQVTKSLSTFSFFTILILLNVFLCI